MAKLMDVPARNTRAAMRSGVWDARRADRFGIRCECMFLPILHEFRFLRQSPLLPFLLKIWYDSLFGRENPPFG
jgi:hypothetical protein